MILTATWVGTFQICETVHGPGEFGNPTLITLLTFMAFDLLMASVIFMPEVWL